MIVVPRRSLAAGALALLTAAGVLAAAPAGATANTRLPSNAAIARVAVADSHPGLPASCRTGAAPRYAVEKINRVRIGSTEVAVVELTCSRATGSTGSELSVYRPSGSSVTRSYFLFRGLARHDDQSLLLMSFTTFGRHVRMQLAGYAAGDSTCCPSHLYRQTSRLSVRSVERGTLKPERVGGPLPSNAAISRAAQAAPHPVLAKICSTSNRPRYHVDRIARMQTDRGPLAIVELTCRYATAGSPVELAAYAALDQHVRRTYTVFRGDETHAGQFLETQQFRIQGRHLRVVLSGTGPKDSLCCPSHWYRQTSELGLTSFVRGKLKPTPAPH